MSRRQLWRSSAATSRQAQWAGFRRLSLRPFRPAVQVGPRSATGSRTSRFSESPRKSKCHRRARPEHGRHDVVWLDHEPGGQTCRLSRVDAEAIISRVMTHTGHRSSDRRASSCQHSPSTVSGKAGVVSRRIVVVPSRDSICIATSAPSLVRSILTRVGEWIVCVIWPVSGSPAEMVMVPPSVCGSATTPTSGRS